MGPRRTLASLFFFLAGFIGCQSADERRASALRRQMNRDIAYEQERLDEINFMRELKKKNEEQIILEYGKPTSIETIGSIRIFSYRTDHQIVTTSNSNGKSKGVLLFDGKVGLGRDKNNSKEVIKESYKEIQFYFKNGMCIDYKEVSQ